MRQACECARMRLWHHLIAAEADELGFTTASRFSRAHCRLLSQEQIFFRRPVEVCSSVPPRAAASFQQATATAA